MCHCIMAGDFEPKSLSQITEDYRKSVPTDLRESKSFEWYLNEVYDDPVITRNAHQRVADMFEYYGVDYDEDKGVKKYKLATEDPLHDGENVFFGENVHQSIHDFVNKVYSGSRGLGPEKRIKLLLGPVGSGKSHFDSMVRKYFELYTRRCRPYVYF